MIKLVSQNMVRIKQCVIHSRQKLKIQNTYEKKIVVSCSWWVGLFEQGRKPIWTTRPVSCGSECDQEWDSSFGVSQLLDITNCLKYVHDLHVTLCNVDETDFYYYCHLFSWPSGDLRLVSIKDSKFSLISTCYQVHYSILLTRTPLLYWLVPHCNMHFFLRV